MNVAVSSIERRRSEPGSGRPGEARNLGSSRDLGLGAAPATLADSDNARAQVDCAVLNISLSGRRPLNRLGTLIAYAFFAGDRAERRSAPAIDLLREEGERGA